MDYTNRLDQGANDLYVLRILNEAKDIATMLDNIGAALDETDVDVIKAKIYDFIGEAGLTLDELLADVSELLYKEHILLSDDVRTELFKYMRE